MNSLAEQLLHIQTERQNITPLLNNIHKFFILLIFCAILCYMPCKIRLRLTWSPYWLAGRQEGTLRVWISHICEKVSSQQFAVRFRNATLLRFLPLFPHSCGTGKGSDRAAQACDMYRSKKFAQTCACTNMRIHTLTLLVHQNCRTSASASG